ncbi:MAG: RidA family protein [Spirochaetales bacterium]
MTVIHSEHAPAAIGPYSQAIEAGGLVWCSGQVPLDPATMKLVEGDITVQTRRALENLKAVAAAAGTTLGHAVRCGVFLTDFADFAAMNAVYAEYFPGKPARTTVEVSALPLGAKVEIDCVLSKG